jgi:REP element-mobilizing transposase RayT
MPDHVHFFCASKREDHSLPTFVGKWKEWTSKYAKRRHCVETPLWQPEFFDHVLRTSESHEEKWLYVRDNPVRAGLVESADDWAYQGELNELRW